MDIDVIVKHMPGLLEFKKRVEALLDGAEAASGTVAEALSNEVADLRKTISSISDDVAALGVLRSGDDKRLTDISGLLDGLAGLKDMADWFAANREGLEVLLSIGDDLAPATPAASTPTPQPDPAPAPAPVVDPVLEPLAPAPEPQSADPSPAPSAAPDLAPADAPQPDIAADPAVAAAPIEPAAAAEPTATDQAIT